MRFKRINRSDPEYVDVPIVNVAGATITLGLPAAYCTTAASVDGINAVLPAASNNATFAGIALSDIPNTGVGLVRAYGYTASVAIFATGSSGTVTLGTAVGPGVAGSLGVNSTGLHDLFGPVLTLEAAGAVANSAGTYIKGFVRAL